MLKLSILHTVQTIVLNTGGQYVKAVHSAHCPDHSTRFITPTKRTVLIIC